MIPVRTIIVGSRPRFGYQPGLAASSADGSDESLKQTTKETGRDLKKAAIASASAQMGIAVGIMFIVPPIGTIVGAVYAVVQYFVGSHYSARVKEVITSTVKSIKKKQQEAETAVLAATDAAYAQELPAAQALALSNQPLEGFMSSVGHAFRSAGKAIEKSASQVKDVHLLVTKKAVDAGVKVTMAPVHGVLRGAASVTGGSLSREVTRWDDKTHQDARGLIKYGGNPELTTNVITGKQQLIIAEKKCAELKKNAYAQIDKLRTETLAKIASPAYRQTLRVNIAKALRGDQSLYAEAARLDAEEAAQRQRFGLELAQEQQRLNNVPVYKEGAVPPSVSQEDPTGVGPLTAAEQASIAVEQQSLAPLPQIEAPPARGASLAIGGSLAAAAAYFLFNR